MNMTLMISYYAITQEIAGIALGVRIAFIFMAGIMAITPPSCVFLLIRTTIDHAQGVMGWGYALIGRV